MFLFEKNTRRISWLQTRNACMTCEAVRRSTKASRPLLLPRDLRLLIFQVLSVRHPTNIIDSAILES